MTESWFELTETWYGSDWRPPRPSQLAYGDDDSTCDEDQKDRDRQVGLLLEVLEAFTGSRRSAEKDRAQEEENRNSGHDEGHDLEKHRPPSGLFSRDDAYPMLAIYTPHRAGRRQVTSSFRKKPPP